MTRKEAIKEFQSELKWAELNKYPYISKQKVEADKLAIKALEQEPCEDAISRQAVFDKLNRLIEVERLQGTDEMGYGRERVSAYENMIFEIESEYLYPSVTTQEPKTGHWIKMSDGFSPYQCSECETVEFKASNYCPKCGARLEVEE